MNIRDIPEVLDAINAIIANHGIAEVKCEDWKDGTHVLVVEQTRTVKSVFPSKSK